MPAISRFCGVLLVSGILLLFSAALSAAAPRIQGYYVVHSNVNGAHVLFDNVYKGDIRGGSFTY